MALTSSKHLIMKSQLLGAIIVIGLTCTIQLAHGEPYSWAENVCNRSEPVKKDILIETPVQYEIKVSSMCGILPCTKTRIETRQDQVIKTIVMQKERLACCEGYTETPQRQCAPICLESCNRGKCVAPNVCKCQPEPSESSPGFVGPTCKRFTCLSNQRWGSKCERECPSQCSQTSYCSADTGKCLCLPGWHGPNCSLECDAYSDVDECQGDNDKLPAIVEPEANFLPASSGNQITLSRAQRPEALVLSEDGDEVKIIQTRGSDGQTWAIFASNYLIGLLSLMSLIFLAAFLIVKRRYELVRNELYYASATSAISSRSSAGGSPGASGGSDYSTGGDGASSNYYDASRAPSTIGGDSNLEKNLSFATATRNILSGVVGGGGKANQDNSNNNKLPLLFAPRVESHLIRSQKPAEQNIYSELDGPTNEKAHATNIANRARAITPTRRLSNASADDHIYAVPKSPPTVSQYRGDELSKPHDTSVDIGDDDSIYEEIKPRGGGAVGINKQ